MIVGNRSLIIPKSESGWDRLWLVPTRNFSYPDSRAGLISGCVAVVPGGSDITPFLPANTWNSIQILRYNPPTSLALEHEYSNSFDESRWVHDADFRDMAGALFFPERINAYQRFFGTFANIVIDPDESGKPAANSYSYLIKYNLQRGGFVSVYEYEQGGDGVVTPSLQGGVVSPVKAFRVSDGTWQILSEGGMTLPAGTGEFWFNCSWSSGVFATQMTAKLRFSVEVPYGL